MSPWHAEINEEPVRLTVFRFFEEGMASITLHLEWKRSGVSLFSIGYQLPGWMFGVLDWLLPSRGVDGQLLKRACRAWPRGNEVASRCTCGAGAGPVAIGEHDDDCPMYGAGFRVIAP